MFVNFTTLIQCVYNEIVSLKKKLLRYIFISKKLEWNYYCKKFKKGFKSNLQEKQYIYKEHKKTALSGMFTLFVGQ